MAGGLISANGDVQLGADNGSGSQSLPVLLRKGTGLHAAANFNPWSSPDWDTPREKTSGYRFGVTPGVDTASNRRIEFTVWVDATDNATAVAAFKKLHDVVRPYTEPWNTFNTILDPQELSFQMWGKKLVCYGFFRGIGVENMDLAGRYKFPVKIRFDTINPFFYDCAVTTITTLTFTTAQHACPLTSPLQFSMPQFLPGGAGSAPAPVFDGDGPPKWKCRITGPTSGSVYNPAICNSQYRRLTGIGTASTGAGLITLTASNHYVEFDGFWQRIVHYDGGTAWDRSKYLTLGAGWDTPSSGTTLYLAYKGNNVSVNAAAGMTSTFSYQPAYWYGGP